MRILFTIAWRNIRQHKTKTFIISAIMIIGITILILGNSLLDSASAGLERYFIKNCTGHLIVTGATKGKLSLFGFMDTSCMEMMVPRLPDYPRLVEFASSLPYVEAVNPQVYAATLLSSEDKTIGSAQIFGVIPKQYQEMFPDNLEFLEGGFWQGEGEGVILSKFIVDHNLKYNDMEINVGDRLVFTSMGTQTGMKIREVEVSGIFEFKQSNPMLEMVCLMDISNVRSLSGMVIGHVDKADLSEVEASYLGKIDQDDIFASFDDLLGGSPLIASEVDDDYWFSFLTDEDTGNRFVEDTGAWQYLLVRLKDESYTKRGRADFAQYFAENNIEAQTIDWRQGAGYFAEISYSVKNIFNSIILVVAVVAVIIIMNTLVIAIMERMGEIGTMRAIGAQRGFVRRMILMETLLLTGISGVLGILLGAFLIFVLNLLKLEASNMFFEIIFGGPVLKPVISLSSLITSLLVVILVGVVASLYPTSLVMKTSPLRAMESRGD